MLAVAFDPVLGEGDLSIVNQACVEGAGVTDLATLVQISLFCDAPAQAGDGVAATTPRAGYWADAFEDRDTWGSRLWTLDRAKLVDETCRKAEAFSIEALRWMVEDGLASKVQATASIRRLEGGTSYERAIYLEGTIVGPDGSRTPWGPWQVIRGV